MNSSPEANGNNSQLKLSFFHFDDSRPIRVSQSSSICIWPPNRGNETVTLYQAFMINSSSVLYTQRSHLTNRKSFPVSTITDQPVAAIHVENPYLNHPMMIGRYLSLGSHKAFLHWDSRLLSVSARSLADCVWLSGWEAIESFPGTATRKIQRTSLQIWAIRGNFSKSAAQIFYHRGASRVGGSTHTHLSSHKNYDTKRNALQTHSHTSSMGSIHSHHPAGTSSFSRAEAFRMMNGDGTPANGNTSRAIFQQSANSPVCLQLPFGLDIKPHRHQTIPYWWHPVDGLDVFLKVPSCNGDIIKIAKW